MNTNNALCSVHIVDPTQAENMNTINMHNAYASNIPTWKYNKTTQKHNKPLI
jgi:hypothetical protein